MVSSLTADRQHELPDQPLEYDQFNLFKDLQQPETITEQLYNFLEAGQRVYFDATSPNNIKLGSKLSQNKVGDRQDLVEVEDKLQSSHDPTASKETLAVNKSNRLQHYHNSNNNCKNVSLIQEKTIAEGKSLSTEFVIHKTLTSHSNFYPFLDTENHQEQPIPKHLDKTPSRWSKSEQKKDLSDDSSVTLVNDKSSESSQVSTSQTQSKAKYLQFKARHNLPKSVASPQDRVAEFILDSANFMDKSNIFEAGKRNNSIQPLGKRGNSTHHSAAPLAELVATESTKGRQPLQGCVGNKSYLNETDLSSDLYTTCDEGFDENTSNTGQLDNNKQWPQKFVGLSPLKTDQSFEILPSKLPALSQMETEQTNKLMTDCKPSWKPPTQMLLDDTLITLDGSFHARHPQTCSKDKKASQLFEQPILNGNEKVFEAPWENLKYSFTAPKKRISNESIFSTISVKDIVDVKTGLTLVERVLPSDCGSLSDRRSLDSTVTTRSTFSEETQIYDWSMLQTRLSKPVAQHAKITTDTPKSSNTRINVTGKSEPTKVSSSPASFNENLKTKTSCLDSESTQAYDWSSLVDATASIQITSPDTRTKKHLAESNDPSQSRSPVTRSKVELDNNILVPNHLKKLSCEEVSSRLKNYGELLGPVTVATKQVYLRRLASLESNPGLVTLTTIYPGKITF